MACRLAPHGWTTRILAALGLLAVLPAWAAEHRIEGINYRGYEAMFFEPAFLAIEPGDRVSFVVNDFDHQPRSVLVPPGARHWLAEQGRSITVELTVEGVYVFDCAYHNVMGMAGVLVVGRPANAAEARRFFEGYRQETFAMSRDRLDPIWDPETGLLAQLEAAR